MSFDPFMDFEDSCRQALAEQIAVPPSATMTVPPRRQFGDLSSNAAFVLSKELKRAPRQIAAEIAAKIDLGRAPLIKRVEVAGAGYINFYLDDAAFAKHVLQMIQSKGSQYGAPQPETHLRVLIEHTSVNPNKEWHIGHARNAILGDVIGRLYRCAGHEVEIQNYIDDTGKQVADSLYATQYFHETPSEGVKLDHFLGELYVRLHRILGRQEDARAELKVFEGKALSADEQKRQAELLAELDEIERVARGVEELMHAVERGEYVGQVARLLDAQLQTAWTLGVYYDLLSWEGDIIRSGLFQEAMEKIKRSPYVYLAESGPKKGCWVINMTDFWEGGKAEEDSILEKVLVRSNGLPTYEAKDIAYQMWKFGLLERDMLYRPYTTQPNGQPLWTTWREGTKRERRHFDRVINVIAAPQSYAQAVVYTALRVTGHEEAYRNSHHLAYGMVSLPSGQMSGRRGIGISTDEVLQSTVEEAYRRVQEKRAGGLSEAEMRRIAEAIGRSAVRYCMVQYDPLKEIVFDIDAVLSLDGNTSSYLQYALVRCEAIARKAREDAGLDVEAIWASASELQFAELEEEENILINALARLPGIIQRCLAEHSPHFLTDYAFDLAGLFNQFYHKCAVLKAPTEGQVRSRLALTRAVNQVLSNAFALLGLEKLEAM